MTRRGIIRWTLRGLAGLLLLALVTVVLLITPPGWYRPPSPDNELAVQLAEIAEQRLAEEAYLIREPDEPWSLRIREDQVNAWLALRMPDWISNHTDREWPAAFGTPQVRFRTDRILLAVRIDTAYGRRTFVIHFEPDVDEQSQFRPRVSGIGIGRLGTASVSGERVHDLLESFQPGIAERPEFLEWMEILTGDRALNAMFRLADRREI
ncbi:MAG: hypothetical protein EA377_00725, partial [Phycisphaerales bacterium]